MTGGIIALLLCARVFSPFVPSQLDMEVQDGIGTWNDVYTRVRGSVGNVDP